jgi:hypothetical protein
MPQDDDDQDDLAVLAFFGEHHSRSDDDCLESAADALSGQSEHPSRSDDDCLESAADALSGQSEHHSQDTTTDVDAIRSVTDDATDDAQAEAAADFVTQVTNPPGTVSVRALQDGSIQEIDLSPKVTSMTELALAEEILVIADLARQKGLASQQAFIADAMQALELHDGDAAHELVEDSLDLPTPQQAETAQAEVFASRYAAGTD